jgi:hypothetical protein
VPLDNAFLIGLLNDGTQLVPTHSTERTGASWTEPSARLQPVNCKIARETLLAERATGGRRGAGEEYGCSLFY